MRRTPALPLLAIALGLLLSGCSQGSESFDSTRDDPNPVLQPLVRTPSPLADDVPSTDPPLTVPLPGASGGPPGTARPVVPDASPGADQDGGDGDSAGTTGNNSGGG